MKGPHLNYEKKLWQQGFLTVGVDEVGRGSLAGPVVAVACVFSANIEKQLKKTNIIINDSKKLTLYQRENAYSWIIKNCLFYSVGKIWLKQINQRGINKANFSAMRQAVSKLKKVILLKKSSRLLKLFVLSDYYFIPYLRKINQKPIIHGDGVSLTIAAASIIAKVERDRLMVKLAKQRSVYRWEKNKGYGTLEHREAIKKYGITKYHRIRFVRNILQVKTPER
jgi:ribonuclease HII